METVSIRFENKFLQNIEKVMKNNNYSTKAEFIREAIRDKILDLEKQEYLLRTLKLYGTGKDKHKNITKKTFYKARQMALKELAKELRVDFD